MCGKANIVKSQQQNLGGGPGGGRLLYDSFDLSVCLKTLIIHSWGKSKGFLEGGRGECFSLWCYFNINPVFKAVP